MHRPLTTTLAMMDLADKHAQSNGLFLHPRAPLFASHRHLPLACRTLVPSSRSVGSASGGPLRAAIIAVLYAGDSVHM